MARTVHRGAIKFGTPAASDLSPSAKGAITRARLRVITERAHPNERKYVAEAWKAVRGRKSSIREGWLRMMESTNRQQAAAWADFLQDEMRSDISGGEYEDAYWLWYHFGA